MSIKYWEFEDAPLKEKLKKPSIREVVKIFYDNETEAYRFAMLINEVKKKGGLRLRDLPKTLPKSTSKRYLDNAVEFGLLKHEDGVYMLTDRYTRPLKNIATYIKAWTESQIEEDLLVEFPNAQTGKRSTGEKQPEPEEKPAAEEKK
jgi:hypothetical protein